MAKELSVKTEDKSLNDSDDSSSSQNKFSSLPHDQEQSTKTSISMGSFPQGKDSTSSEDLFVAPNDMAGDKAETKITSEQEIIKLVKEDVQAVLSLEGEAIGHLSTPTSSSNEFNFHDIKGPPNPIHPTDFQSSTFLIITDSPILSEGSYSRMPLAPSSSPVLALTSWLGGGSPSEVKPQSAGTPSLESFVSMTEIDSSLDLKSTSQGLYAANTYL